MTRRDYVKLAAAVREASERAARIERSERMVPDMPRYSAGFGVQLAVEALADALAADNPRFDRARFYSAAGF